MQLRREDERESISDRETRARLMVIVSACLLAALGLLFRGISSSPTSKGLAFTGARPAEAPEAQCKRLLENLSIGVGLPTPQLYVIESSSPRRS
jgi:hypothetical protein